MTLYAVIYKDGSWGNTGHYILGIYDNEEQANKLVEHVHKRKNNFNRLSGSQCYIEEYELNEDCADGYIDYLA